MNLFDRIFNLGYNMNMYLAIILALIAFLLVREVLAYRERRDMLDRLMAKNLPEYKDNQKEEPNEFEEEEDPDLLPIDQARDAIDGREEEN